MLEIFRIRRRASLTPADGTTKPSTPEGQMDESPQPRTAEVESVTDELAIVTVRGEHDLGTKSALEDALARACRSRHVLVDLSHCDFMDSTALAVLLVAHRTQVERGGRLELVIPTGVHPIERITRLARIQAIVTTLPTRDAGVSSITSDP
jgi:anti-anti-sigma factor